MREFVLRLNPWGVAVILRLQQGGTPALDTFWRVITHFGDGYYLLLVLFLFWCLDKRRGTQLATLYLISFVVNALVKAAIASPRPFVDSAVLAKVTAAGYSFPSGHAQLAATFGLGVICMFRRAWVALVTVPLVLLIAYSRVYLGVHYPQDVLAGLLLGSLISLLFIWLRPDRSLSHASWVTVWRSGLAVIVAVLLMLTLPQAYRYLAAGGCLGAGVGYALEERWMGFRPTPGRRACLLRLGLGLGCAAPLLALGAWPAVWAALTAYPALGLGGAALLGFVLTWLVPWLFVRRDLATREVLSPS